MVTVVGSGTVSITDTSKWRPVQIAIRIAGIYALLGLLWSFVSSQSIDLLRGDAAKLALDQNNEATSFILLSAVAVYCMVRFYASRMTDAYRIAHDAQKELVNRLALASEYRDDMTGMHNKRMSLCCGALAEALGCDSERSELIALAAALHDVGKIGVPDAILNKPGGLTPEERATMETHVLLGAGILEGAWHPLLQTAHEIALTHHEAWDGSGYPNGLKGEEIPLEGRIAAVCDTFDALTSERPYKEAWPVAEAVKEIVRQSGKRFDPRVVEAFVEIVPKLVAIREECNAMESKKTFSIQEPVDAQRKAS